MRGDDAMQRRDFLAGLPLAALPLSARAQAWPTRPITFISPLAAGSSVDIMTRMMAEHFTGQLGQPVVVENRPSANGNLAMGQVARGTPDGYTLITMGQTGVAFNPHIYPSLPFDPLKDFTYVTRMVAVSNALIVRAESPFRSVADIVAAAKANPGKLTYSSGGVGSTHHVSSAMFGQMAGLELVHVPYRGAPQGILAAQTGEVDFAFYNISTLLQGIRAGTLRALAVTSATRSTFLPDVPTMQESGIAGYEMATWFGFAVTAGTPAPIVNRLYDCAKNMMADPAAVARVTAQGFDTVSLLTPAEMIPLVRAEYERWGPILRAAGARLE
jgi:tripartite-type tricarboxylate transporter receptor subunit TctC